jgi:hypothetical protein
VLIRIETRAGHGVDRGELPGRPRQPFEHVEVSAPGTAAPENEIGSGRKKGIDNRARPAAHSPPLDEDTMRPEAFTTKTAAIRELGCNGETTP